MDLLSVIVPTTSQHLVILWSAKRRQTKAATKIPLPSLHRSDTAYGVAIVTQLRIAMDLNPSQNIAINNAVETAHTHLDAASQLEILCVLLIPLLALLIGTRLSHFIATRTAPSLAMRALAFIAPMASPLLATLFSFVAKSAFEYEEMELFLLPFAVKLAVAWSAIRLVRLMSTRQSAGWVIACFILPITLLHMFNLWDAAVKLLSGIAFTVNDVKISIYLVLKSITVVVALQWAASFAVRTMDSRLSRVRDMRASNRTLIVKIFQILLYCFVFVMGMQLLGISLAALSVFGGALGVGLGFGLQKIASNFISGIILLFEKSIEVDDLIELTDGTTGFVRETRARYTLMETQDGREVLIPNEEFISQRVTSWTHSNHLARAQINVSIGYECDVALARQLMLDAAMQHPKRSPARDPLCVLNNFADNGIELILYFWVADVVDGCIEPKSEVMIAILDAFKTHGITIPYPQREVRVVQTNPSLTDAAL